MFNTVAIIFAAISLVTLIIYGADKLKAINGAWRIPERVLLGFSLLGGALGGSLAMLLFRHKTRHWYFTAVNAIGLIWQISLLVILKVKGF